MTRNPQDTSAEEPDGGNLHVRFRGGPGRGDRPGLLNMLDPHGLCAPGSARIFKQPTNSFFLESTLMIG